MLWSKSQAWTKTDKQPIVVGLLLSGGGYRAAMIHAGLLEALDERCVPIRYLITVSGGSIIGGYYSLGYPPERFKEKLMRRRSGLPDDMLAIHDLPLDWLWPSWSSADTYARHFQNVFFGSSTLDDTLFTPQLIVNATDIEADPDDAREVFFEGREPSYPELDRTKIADLVAASGSFPGAFEPKTIVWPKDSGSGLPVSRRFVDGGVVENLGITGLHRFLDFKSGSSPPPSPDLTIISDASLHGRAEDLPEQVALLELLTRSEDISYDTLQRLIYEQLPEAFQQKVFPIHETDMEGIANLRGDEFRSALETGNPKPVAGEIVAAEVAKYSTLKELSPSEVEKAFWIVHTLGVHYWHAIDAERERLGGQGPACSSQ
jgi:predicted acylesterase/phospholipase RssA